MRALHAVRTYASSAPPTPRSVAPLCQRHVRRLTEGNCGFRSAAVSFLAERLYAQVGQPKFPRLRCDLQIHPVLIDSESVRQNARPSDCWIVSDYWIGTARMRIASVRTPPRLPRRTWRDLVRRAEPKTVAVSATLIVYKVRGVQFLFLMFKNLKRILKSFGTFIVAWNLIFGSSLQGNVNQGLLSLMTQKILLY